METAMHDPVFERFGNEVPQSPVILSVTHAGRAYSDEICRDLILSPSRIVGLEDRYVDLVALAARGSETMLVARMPRAWVDLNRSERDRDPRIDDGARRLSIRQSDKVRSGLGIIPRRAGGVENIWRRQFSDHEVRSRIDQAHTPFHATLADLLASARARFGVAILLDIHSMPPLTGRRPPAIVIGDRFGSSCASTLSVAAAAAAERFGVSVAMNRPYAGGHTLDRHGAPRAGVHALQLEIDRSLYLDDEMDQPAEGIQRTAALVRGVIDALADEAIGHPLDAAAE